MGRVRKSRGGPRTFAQEQQAIREGIPEARCRGRLGATAADPQSWAHPRVAYAPTPPSRLQLADRRGVLSVTKSRSASTRSSNRRPAPQVVRAAKMSTWIQSLLMGTGAALGKSTSRSFRRWIAELPEESEGAQRKENTDEATQKDVEMSAQERGLRSDRRRGRN